MKPEEKIIHQKVQEARSHYLDQNYQKAIENYTVAMKLLDEKSEDMLIIKIELGWSYYYNKEYGKAIQHLKDALQFEDINEQQKFDCLRIIGFSYEMLKNHREAQKALQNALSVNVPEESKRYTYFELGKILFTEGQIIEAEHYFQLAQPLFKEDEQAYRLALEYYLGFSAFYQKKFDLAKRHFEKILGESKDAKMRASGFFGLAHLFYKNKDYSLLIDTCEKILRLDPTFFDKETLGYFMCSAYLHLKMWDELEMFFNELESNYPKGRYASEYPKFREALKKRGAIKKEKVNNKSSESK